MATPASQIITLRPLPVVDLDDLAKLREVSEALLTDAAAFVITDDATYDAAMEIHDTVKVRVKAIEDHRKSITAPINDALGRINDEHKRAKAPLDAIVKLLNDRGSRFIDERAARKAAEDRRAAETLARRQAKAAEQAMERGEEVTPIVAAPAPPSVAVPEKTSRTETTTGTWREVVTFKVVDESLLPREYLVPDSVKIGKVVKAGVEVPGVERIVNRVRSTRAV